ncbi:aromatic prenyltransferase [Delitschia confertaspora ATCC 74209]|uniref:Aromatic prenyltransferase n=1 Tax=Delitschia confertaspora ATCC 74209 TaxID=1513339 RepID=A0A9P4JSV2_9PLEO|nr:aromatic prenyltransferase [Delitschia confertaspora ATCC 74209]
MAPSLETETDKDVSGVMLDEAASKVPGSFWWNTSGQDLAKMLQEAKYPEAAQRSFLTFYRDVICQQLGARPDSTSTKSGVGRDGNPFEYSFELKGSTKSQTVRFVVDVTELRPADDTKPLSNASNQKVIDVLAKKTPGFDDTWYRNLKQWFIHDQVSTEKQRELVAKAGYQTQLILGFDIRKSLTAVGELPVMGKMYFSPCFTAACKDITRWETVRLAIHQLPNISTYPNILQSLSLIQEYLKDKPKEYEDGTRYLATDFVHPDKARLKIYMRYPGTNFENIWDYYTLGGRIPGLDEDKEKFRDLMNLVSGIDEVGKLNEPDHTPYTAARNKATAIYFSLSSENPYPAPKICFYPANFAATDEVIAKGLDKWLEKYEWYDGGKTMEDRIKSVFTHRKLEEKPGILTFIGIGRKEDPTKKDLSLQCYVSPELYENPRI